jgi:tRNA(Ile)-lysidine synthase
MLDKVRETITKYRMFTPGDTVVVAVSGGPDSMALLHGLVDLRTEFSLTIHVAHFDHHLRPDSGDDAAFVQAAAASLELPVTLGMGDVRTLAASQRRSMEDAARQARYAFFAQVAAATGAAALATAHTRDDQIETVLMRVLDRAPWESLAGIPPVRWLTLNPSGASGSAMGRVKVVRPLLDLSRSEVLTFLHAGKVDWRDDPTNLDQTIRRNWIRHAVIPALAPAVPSLAGILEETGQAIREVDSVLAAAARHLFDRSHRREGAAVSIPLATIGALPRPVQRRMMREALAAVAGTDAGIPRVVEDEVLALLTRRRPGEVGTGTWVFRRSYDAFVIGPAPPPPPDEVYELPVPGEVNAGGFGVRVLAEYVDITDEPPAGPREAVMDAEATGPVLRIRSVRPGDRIRPLGMGGKKKVQDLLVDGKVPRWERARIPLIVDAEGRVLWVVGQRVSEDARVTAATKRAVRLRVLPVGAAATPFA